VDKNEPSSGSGIREYRDDGSCWERQPLPEEIILEIVQMLLQAGADPNIPECQRLPLFEAVDNGQLQLLQLLLASGARLDVRDRYGHTPVSLAQLYNQQNILAFLREYTGTDLSEFERQEPEDDENCEEDDERWGEELPQPDFSEAARNQNYQQAVRELAEICGSTPTSHDRYPGWFSIHVNSKRRQDIKTEELQRQFLEKGCFVYEPNYHYGEGPNKLCILPTTDKYEAIALHQTNGGNYGIGPGYVVQWLKDLEARQPFVLTCIAHDTLAGRFLTPIADPEGLAERMYDFCSDLVDLRFYRTTCPKFGVQRSPILLVGLKQRENINYSNFHREVQRSPLLTQKRSGLFCTSRLVEYAIMIPLDSSWEAKMTADFPKIDLSGVQPDLQTLKSFEQLLDYIESTIDPSQEPAAIASLCKLKKEIIKLKSQKKPGDGMLHAGVSELRKAFHAHKDAIRERKGISYYLLLFYAVECGLKSIWLQRKNLLNTNQVEDKSFLSKYGHNLDKWVKELKVDPRNTPNFHLAGGGANLDIEKAHQAWRYGIGMKSEDEEVVVEWLENVCNWIKENIKR